ncbi:lipoyl domain-containing protein [Noviherbaspirillum sedimenti]|uniref:Dihydrolipoamide acyltransferase n=1 Tax=Noviherbaspirillum sedimenti TaxID=2320865 RepID=A0A3A3FWM9_9BURK|nr:lipoyl domain-containing protein [Noviherbaspirillum sedimenti]RJG00628.1 dihydrolipoamide acyltransferase [Noviherbaspirillum sedimenti]
MELRIPQSGDAVTEVQLVEWHVADGAEVKEGDVVYSIESEKAVIDIEAPAAGKVKIIEQAGAFLAIGHLVGSVA